MLPFYGPPVKLLGGGKIKKPFSEKRRSAFR